MDLSESIHIMDLSGSQWIFADAHINETHRISVLRRMPADIGFRKQADDSVEVFFQPALKTLDWRSSEVVCLMGLADEWHRIRDEDVSYHLLGAFIKGLTFGLVGETGDLYVIIPYRWPYMNRQKLRQLLTAMGRHSPFRFRGFINEGIALLTYWKNQKTDIVSESFRLFWLDGRLRDLKVWCYNWSENCVEINSVFIVKDYKLRETDEVSEEIKAAIESLASEEQEQDYFAVGSGDGGVLESLMEALEEKLSVECIDIYDEAHASDKLLLGAVCWADSLMGKGNCAAGYQINYDWSFGVQVDVNEILEVIPRGTNPPVKVQRLLTVRGEFSPFPLNLYCCFAPSVSSGLPIASLRVEPEGEYRQRGSLDILVEVELMDRLRGNFSIAPKGQDKGLIKPFRVPVLVE